MKCVKYTLDRYEGDVGVLLLKGDESQELIVSLDKLAGLNEGDIVLVEFGEDNEVLKVTVLDEESKITRDQVQDLLERLKNKK